MANRSVITAKGLSLLSKASASGENSFWIGYYALAYVPEENRGEGKADYLTSATNTLTTTGDRIYNIWQGSMTPTGFDTNSTAYDLYTQCLYTSNIQARYRYVLDKDGKNNLVMWRGTDDSNSYKLSGATVYRGIGAVDSEGNVFEESQMPIPAPLFYMGEPVRYDNGEYTTEAALIEKICYPNNNVTDYPVFENLPAVSTDTRDYTASSKKTLQPPTDSDEGFSSYGGMSGETKYEWAAAERTYKQDDDAFADSPIVENANRYCQQYWKYQSISNFNRFHAPASSEGFCLDYEPSCRNMAKVTKYFPISYYEVMNAETQNPETKSSAPINTMATSLQFTVSLQLNDFNNIVANRTNTAELDINTPSDIESEDGIDLFETRKTSFKFNRIGIYAVPVAIHHFSTEDTMTDVCNDQHVQFEVMGDAEPVLFAVADIDEVTVKEGGSISQWSTKFTLNLSDATTEGAILRDTAIFYNMYEDDAITWYKNQLLATASLSEAVINQGIEINYLRNMINDMEYSAGACNIINDNSYGSGNARGGTLMNLEDSAKQGNAAVKGIYTGDEGGNKRFYNAKKAGRANAMITMDDGIKVGLCTTRGVLGSDLVDESNLIETLFGQYSSDTITDKFTHGFYDSSSKTWISTEYIYLATSDVTHNPKVYRYNYADGTVFVYDSSSSPSIHELVPDDKTSVYEFLRVYRETFGEDDMAEVQNYSVGKYTLNMGNDSFNAAPYSITNMRYGAIDDTSISILGVGGETVDSEPNVFNDTGSIGFKDAKYSIFNMGGQVWGNKINGSMLLSGQSVSADTVDYSILNFKSGGSMVSNVTDVFGILTGGQTYSNLSSSVIISSGAGSTFSNISNSLMINCNANGYSNISNSIFVYANGPGTNGGSVDRVVNFGSGSEINKPYNHNDMILDVVENLHSRTFKNALSADNLKTYGSVSGIMNLGSGVYIGNWEVTEALYGSDDSFDSAATDYNTALTIPHSTSEGFGIWNNTYGIIETGGGVHVKSASRHAVVLGDGVTVPVHTHNSLWLGSGTVYGQPTIQNVLSVDEMNRRYGDTLPDGNINHSNLIVIGDGTLSLKNGDNSVMTKQVKGVCLYVSYSDTTKTWTGGYTSDDDNYEHYADVYRWSGHLSNILSLGNANLPGHNSHDSIFIGTNSAWPRTTFNHCLISNMGDDAGVRYSNYSSDGTLKTIPHTTFENVAWFGHMSTHSTGTGNLMVDGLSGYYANHNDHAGMGYSDGVFRDVFAFVGNNKHAFNESYWYGVDSNLFQPAQAPMMYTGGIALGGWGGIDCYFGLLKLGVARETVSSIDGLAPTTSRNMIAWASDTIPSDSTYFLACSYADAKSRKVMLSPHRGKCLMVDDWQELDGTLHVTVGNPLLGALGDKINKQRLLHCTYISTEMQFTFYDTDRINSISAESVVPTVAGTCTVPLRIEDEEWWDESTQTVKTTVTKRWISDKAFKVNTFADAILIDSTMPDCVVGCTVTATNGSSYVYDYEYTIWMAVSSEIRYFMPWSNANYTENASSEKIGVNIVGSRSMDGISELYGTSSSSSRKVSYHIAGIQTNAGGVNYNPNVLSYTDLTNHTLVLALKPHVTLNGGSSTTGSTNICTVGDTFLGETVYGTMYHKHLENTSAGFQTGTLTF